MNVPQLWGPVYCPFRRITGIPCPLCGTTTAAVLLVRGRLVDALQVNPLGVLVVLVAVWVVGSRATALAQGRPVTRPQLPPTLPRWQVAAGAAVASACWFIRLHAPGRLVGG